MSVGRCESGRVSGAQGNGHRPPGVRSPITTRTRAVGPGDASAGGARSDAGRPQPEENG
ncbi:hypothetical protein SHL15_5543 [Streptomyces hygroscopicus subsp. limoneus]|nr:hypothetical protein SHL15_5543 [Streptomyces hygroscopicus subsp. limoneus]